jgi:ATP-binding cassette subfamily F protein 3
LIDALATQVWDVLPDERLLKVFPGTYSQYSLFRRREKEGDTLLPTVDRKVSDRKAEPQPQKQKSSAKTRKQQEQMKKLEAEISRLENELDAVSRQLENPPSDPQQVQVLGQSFNALQHTLDEQIREWETLSADL